MKAATKSPQEAKEDFRWRELVKPFQEASLRSSLWQVVNSVGGYLALVTLMIWIAHYSLWAVVPVAVIAGGFLVRVFIIFHDCTHGSFFRARWANEACGFITGLLCFTPFHQWKWEHIKHHSHAGDLDERGFGDVWTMTVEEYCQASRLTKLRYRCMRNPFFLFLIAPAILFFLIHRLPSSESGRKAMWSLHLTNLGLAAISLGIIQAIGWREWLLVQCLPLYVASCAGVWLFYVQHQFEDVVWERNEDWDFAQAALQGSSFYRLPRVLQWFSGNIGFHHMHHLSPKIPNYHLEKCHEASPVFQSVKAVTLRGSLRAFQYRLWDEKERRLVGFQHLKTTRRTGARAPASRT